MRNIGLLLVQLQVVLFALGFSWVKLKNTNAFLVFCHYLLDFIVLTIFKELSSKKYLYASLSVPKITIFT